MSVADRQSKFYRRSTRLYGGERPSSSFPEAVMVFLVFSEVLEMSSEVAGPGPTHGRSNLRVLTWDLLLVPSRPMPDACYPLVLFVVCVWGFPPGAPSWRCPQSSLFLFYKIQLSTGSLSANKCSTLL